MTPKQRDAYQKLGRAFSEHRTQTERRGRLVAKRRRIADALGEIQSVGEKPSTTIRECQSAIQIIDDDGDMPGLLRDLGAVSGDLEGLRTDPHHHGMPNYLRD